MPRLTHVRVLAGDFSASYALYQTSGDTRLAVFPCAEMASDVELRAPGEDPVLVRDVGDVDEAAARPPSRPASRGAALVDEPHDRPEWGLRVLHLRDPDGGRVELFHDIEWVRE